MAPTRLRLDEQMMRPWKLLAPTIVALTGCSQPHSTTIVAPVSQMPVTADTSLSARLRRDLEGWQTRAEQVRWMRVVAPDTLRLIVGSQFGVQGIHLEARDSLGQAVERFVPAFSVTDRAIVELQGGTFVGRRAGRAEILVGVTRMDSATGQRRMHEMGRIPVVVRPAP